MASTTTTPSIERALKLFPDTLRDDWRDMGGAAVHADAVVSGGAVIRGGEIITGDQ